MCLNFNIVTKKVALERPWLNRIHKILVESFELSRKYIKIGEFLLQMGNLINNWDKEMIYFPLCV